jgi:AcrR family transcriptional regulator
MREIKIPESGPKRHLLDVAEHLLAVKGFESVSVRDITREAAVNVAAVNYHFGSRETLVSLVIVRHLKPLNEERAARVEVLERKSSGKGVVPVEEIIEALTRPLVGAVRKSGLEEPVACELLGRILALRSPGFPEEMEMQMQTVIARFMRILGKALPTVPAEELVWRMHFVTGGMIQMLMGRAGSGFSSVQAIDATLGRFIRFASAGLREGVEAETAPTNGPQATFDF